MPLGYALAPLAADAFGAAVPLAVAGLLVLASCGGTSLVPGVRRLTWPTAREPQAAEPAGVR